MPPVCFYSVAHAIVRRANNISHFYSVIKRACGLASQGYIPCTLIFVDAATIKPYIVRPTAIHIENFLYTIRARRVIHGNCLYVCSRVPKKPLYLLQIVSCIVLY